MLLVRVHRFTTCHPDHDAPRRNRLHSTPRHRCIIRWTWPSPPIAPAGPISREDALRPDSLPRRRSPRTARRGPRRQRALQARRHHLFAQGLPAADQSLPRLLRILHLPPRSRRPRRAHHDARRSARGRPRRRKTRMHRSPLQPRRQARTALPRDARDAAPSRLQVHAALSRSHVRTGAARDQPAAASESRPAQRGMDRAPGRRFPQHGPDARNHERRAARARARPTTTLPTKSRPNACAPSKTPASRMSRSPPAC